MVPHCVGLELSAFVAEALSAQQADGWKTVRAVTIGGKRLSFLQKLAHSGGRLVEGEDLLDGLDRACLGEPLFMGGLERVEA